MKFGKSSARENWKRAEGAAWRSDPERWRLRDKFKQTKEKSIGNPWTHVRAQN